MRILLLSPYDADSHRRWREGLVAALPGHDWTIRTLPPRHFSWRIRGNPLQLARELEAIGNGGWERVIATSMTDLATLRGLVPSLATVPTLLYFHENQFVYPAGQAAPRLEPLMVTLYGALAAECLVFNSRFNRDTFLDGVAGLLRRMPDAVPPDVVGRLAAKAVCLPVPLEDELFGQPTAPPSRFTIVWNHRWEYDKGPERLAAAMTRLADQGVDFTLHVLGQRFRRVPSALTALRERLGSRIGQWGPVADREAYRALLRRSHVVLSTALHDFQGLAVLEAVACGCRPLVPDRLAYPEWFEEPWRYASFPDDPEAEAETLARRLAALAELQRQGTLPPAPSVAHLAWGRLAPSYGELITSSGGG